MSETQSDEPTAGTSQPADSEPSAAGEGAASSERRMTLGEHLDELRTRLVRAALGLLVGTIAGLCFSQQLLALLERPYISSMQAHGLTPSLQILGLWEGLSMWGKIGLYAGLIASAPWIFYQLWMFVSVGLKERERRYVKMSIPWSVLLFVGGSLFFILLVSKPLMYSLIGLNAWLGVSTNVTLANYVDSVTDLMLVFGLAFQLPLVEYVLGVVGIVSSATLRKYRRHVIVGIFVFSMIFTSPTGLDQVMLAVPMCLLYEAGLLLVRMHEKRKAKAQAEEG